MAVICYKPKGSCSGCSHHREGECYLKIDTKLLMGSTLMIVNMDKEPQYKGRTGVVNFIDDADQIHGTWGTCALIPTLDEFVVLKKGGK